jgi:hypothetical protein
MDSDRKTTEPLPLTQMRIGQYDKILKGKGNMVYFLSSDTGLRINNNGTFTLEQLDQNLINETAQVLNFTNIDCSTMFCEIKDFDLDSDGNVIISVYKEPSIKNLTMIYQMKPSGELGYIIEDPC